METSCDGAVLLVGDGDFSFSLSLLNHGLLSSSQVTSSNLESSETIQQHKLAKTNMWELESRGACVLLEVDARELHTHPVISQKLYSRIIFNFPLADRHNIKKNRALLADFFSSSSQVLSPGGQVMVTLCKGQGGTPADQPQRSWHDSWQALAMAANSGFVLAQIFPFEAAHFPEYHSVGFRFQDKSFDTEGSLVHVFEKTDMVCTQENIVSRGTLKSLRSTYSCSQYIAEKLKRNLLKEESNPVCWMKKELEKILSENFTAAEYPSDFLDAVLAGYKSSVYSSSNLSESEVHAEHLASQRLNSLVMSNVGHEDALTEMKKQKDDSNLIKKQEAMASQFSHGLESQEEAQQHRKSNTSGCLTVAQFIPDDSESVYIFIKSAQKIEHACKVESEDLNEDEISEAERTNINGTGLNFTSSSSDSHISDHNEAQARGCNSDRVFHHRVSLLESLTSCSESSKRPVEMQSHPCSEQNSNVQVPEINKISVGSSITVAGQCCRPTPIEPLSLPVYHELMFIHKLPPSFQDTASSMDNSEPEICEFDNAHFKDISCRLLSCLQSSTLFKEHFHLETQACPNTHKINIEDVCETKNVKLLFSKRTHSNSVLKPMGIILKAVVSESQQYFVTIFNLDSMVCQIRNIPDPRLLWSNNPKVLCQLRKFASSHTSCWHDSYQPISLYPMKFVHDLSFWESSSKAEPFDELGLLDVVRLIGQDDVVKVSLIDKYTEPGTEGRTSRCYRLHFQSHSLAFPYAVSWKLQSLIRIEVAHRLGVLLR